MASAPQIDGERLRLLNNGAIETANLTECLAVDFATLMRATLPEIGTKAINMLKQESQTGILKRMTVTGQLIYEHVGPATLPHLLNCPSDTVRGWGCFLIGSIETMSIEDRLDAIAPLADDHHFGVREWAWMAVRRHIAADLQPSIDYLAEWADNPSERIRRFSSESIRPRGVWCTHIAALKQEPNLALPILEPLHADPAHYVQDSVGNWLNDAAKDQPNWVRSLCQRWLEEAPDNQSTTRIVRRALRSLK
ncbi:hypothetical protein MIM_c13300 [Advenella mimigardefordensis DPN7]|uniref:DNA alkylation repair protein n=2 Tax=Advenella mimigardefordensis TaxID=302406 RepID=W0PD77_ADVMD|nr:hypothetical protein MIM_c13300 [Advenella mimigardefordensis DPN7]